MPAPRRKNGTDGLAVVDAPLDQLHPHPRNPRKITAARLEQLQRTLEAERDMLRARPVIALPDGTVVAGNQRLVAARALGWESIPTVFADLDDQQQTRWMLLDNRPFGEDVDEDVAALLAELDAAGSDLLLTGYDSADIDRIMAAIDRTPADPDAVPPMPEEPKSNPGEVYELGPHRLMCGDATDESTLEAMFGGEAARLMVTSPPYNQNLDTFKASGMQRENPAWVERMAAAYADSKPEPEYQAEQVAALNLWLRYTADDGSLFYNHKLRYRATQFISPLEWIMRTDWRRRQEIVWDRSGSITLNARMFMPSDERIYWLTKSGKFVWNGGAEIKSWSSVWKIAPRAEVQVSAPFPVEIPLRCMRACSAIGDVVFDPFCGSGTTVIAAETLGRRCFAMELDPGYCDVIRQRYADYTNRPDLAP